MSDISDRDANDPDNKKLVHEGWTSLQEKKRSCTDCLCILLLLAMWFAMTILGFVAIGLIKSDQLTPGNPARLINAMDYRGRICGYSPGVEDKDVGYFFPDSSSKNINNNIYIYMYILFIVLFIVY